MAVVRGMGALMIENDGSVVSAKVVDEDGLLFGGAVDVGTVTCPALAESAGVVALEGHGTVSGVCLTTGAP
jgi:hypothetical protein